jgi:Flp pilus assembly protein TadG
MRRSRRRGATMVETAATIFALLFLTLGLIQAGLIYNAMLSLNNLAHEGARYAAIRAKAELAKIPTATPEAERQRQAKAALAKVVSDHLKERAVGTSIEPNQLEADKLTVQASETLGIVSSQPMRLLITYNMKQNKGFVPALLPLPEGLARYTAEGSSLIE